MQNTRDFHFRHFRWNAAVRMYSIYPMLLPSAVRRITAPSSIAITIDDGPHPLATQRALRSLTDHGLNATFFFVGDRAAEYGGLVRECFSEGNGVGNHSLHHSRMAFRKQADIAYELSRTGEILAKSIGHSPRIFRPPYGSWNPLHDSVLKSLKMSNIMWSLMTGDFRDDFRNLPLRQWFQSHLREGDIVVLHANEKTQDTIADSLAAIADVMSAKKLKSVLLPTAN